MDRPIRVMIAVFCLGLGAVGVSYAVGVQQNTLQWELTKMAAQVSVVGVAGALLSFVADNHRRRQDRIRLQEDFFKDLLKRITSSYNKSKGARRMARARGLIPSDKPTHVRLDAYDECMEIVNESQLELEAVMKELGSTMADLPDNAPVHQHVSSMQDYLNQIIGEYERVRLTPEAGAKEVSLADASQFKAFTAKKKKKLVKAAVETKAFGEYADDHGDARKAINDHLLGLGS